MAGARGGRPLAGWTIRLPKGRNVYLVRFTHEGREVERSTRESSAAEAAQAAARIYREVCGGAGPCPTGGAEALGDAIDAWLIEYRATHDGGTADNAEGYGRQWVAYLGGLENFTESGYARYMRERIAKVSRSTLRKELSALRQFAAWLKMERGIAVPPVPGLPKRGHAGARASNARKRTATIMSPEDVAAVIAELVPAWQPFFSLVWETGLRPFSTVAELCIPDHWAPGRETLFIAREIDKAKYERTIPLTPGALHALASAARAAPRGTEGKLFPAVDRQAARWAWETAVRRAGVPGRPSIYDIRHSRISQLANSGAPLAGVSFLVGHKHVSTTAIYVRANEAAAAAALHGLGSAPAPRKQVDLTGLPETDA